MLELNYKRQTKKKLQSQFFNQQNVDEKIEKESFNKK
jgi:hypothetical protein